MTSVNFQQWIQHPETLDRDTLYELRNMLARYPYFQSLRLLYLKNLYILHDINFGAELRKAVLYIADRRKLFQLIEGDRFAVQSRKKGVSLTEVLKNEPSVDRTLALIDAFLSTVPEEVAGQTTFDYSMDYTTSATCKQIRVSFTVGRGGWGNDISAVCVDNAKLTGVSRTYSPKFGFVDNTADIEYFTIDESGAYAPMQPTITINLPSK